MVDNQFMFITCEYCFANRATVVFRCPFELSQLTLETTSSRQRCNRKVSSSLTACCYIYIYIYIYIIDRIYICIYIYIGSIMLEFNQMASFFPLLIFGGAKGYGEGNVHIFFNSLFRSMMRMKINNMLMDIFISANTIYKDISLYNCMSVHMWKYMFWYD